MPPPTLKNFKPSTDNSVRLWDAASGRELHRFDASGDLGGMQIQFSGDGGRLLLVGRLTIRVWDAATGIELFALNSAPNPSGHHTASFSPDLRVILVNEGGSLRLFDYASGKEGCTIGTGSGHYFGDAEFSSDGSRIVAALTDMPLRQPTIQIWDASNCQQTQAFAATATTFSRASFSTDGKNIVANVGGPPSAQMWGQTVRSFVPAGAQYVHDVSLSADGKRLLTRSSFYRGTEMYFVSLWDVESGQELHRFDEGFHRLFVIGFSPDGKTILVDDQAKPVSLWNAETGELIRTYP